MSNQAHKNRTSPRRFNYAPAGFPKGLVNSASVNESDFTRARVKRQAGGMAVRAEKDPEINPSGRAKFKAHGAGYKAIQALPDPSASSRGANVRANKERGTQSSTQRKVIK